MAFNKCNTVVPPNVSHKGSKSKAGSRKDFRLLFLDHVNLFSAFSKYRNDVFHFDNEQSVVPFKVDGYRTFWIEKYFVVLQQWYIDSIFDLGRYSNYSSSDGRYFDVVRKLDSAFSLFFVLIFSDQDAFSDRLDDFDSFHFFVFFCIHVFALISSSIMMLLVFGFFLSDFLPGSLFSSFFLSCLLSFFDGCL